MADNFEVEIEGGTRYGDMEENLIWRGKKSILEEQEGVTDFST